VQLLALGADSLHVRQGSPNTTLRAVPRGRRPDHRPSAAERAVEAERAQVRAWLHDSVLQHLEYIAAGGYADAPDVAALRDVATRAAEELRAYVDGDEAEAPRDLSVALAGVAADARLLAGELRIPVVVGPEVADVPQPVVDALAAATREALANVAKHARARRATVRADVANGAVVVSIADDGVGFDAGKTAFGSGLRHSILDRVTHVGGTATLRSAPGTGTRIVLTVPLPSPDTTAPEVVA
jgi:signal transduction histidine kinase